jgi:hypothetical protein
VIHQTFFLREFNFVKIKTAISLFNLNKTRRSKTLSKQYPQLSLSWKLNNLALISIFQFFKAKKNGDGPGVAINRNDDRSLKDLLVFIQPKVPKPMFYQQLTIPLRELENNKQLDCVFLSPEQKFRLYPNKNGTVTNLVI